MAPTPSSPFDESEDSRVMDFEQKFGEMRSDVRWLRDNVTILFRKVEELNAAVGSDLARQEERVKELEVTVAKLSTKVQNAFGLAGFAAGTAVTLAAAALTVWLGGS